MQIHVINAAVRIGAITSFDFGLNGATAKHFLPSTLDPQDRKDCTNSYVRAESTYRPV